LRAISFEKRPTIRWSKGILIFKVRRQDPQINFLQRYFDIPDIMVSALNDNLKDSKTDVISQIDTKLYKLNALKTKLRNCPTPDFGDDIKEVMPEGTSNKYGRIYVIIIISRTFPDKHINTLFRTTSWNIKITKSKSMESYQRDIICHLKQYDNFKGTEWKRS
jgi:hypothetical protein